MLAGECVLRAERVPQKITTLYVVVDPSTMRERKEKENRLKKKRLEKQGKDQSARNSHAYTAGKMTNSSHTAATTPEVVQTVCDNSRTVQLSTVAVSEPDDTKRVDAYVQAIKALHNDWWNSVEWTTLRNANYVAALRDFNELHRAFADRYPTMFNKILNQAGKFDTREFLTLQKFRQTLLAADKDKNEAKRAFGEYNLHTYSPEFARLPLLLTEYKTQIVNAPPQSCPFNVGAPGRGASV